MQDTLRADAGSFVKVWTDTGELVLLLCYFCASYGERFNNGKNKTNVPACEACHKGLDQLIATKFQERPPCHNQGKCVRKPGKPRYGLKGV